jgi:biopolymer transport protein ExbB/TolQ
MLHELLGRLAQYGGEAALGVLFVLSIVNVGIISQRVWVFVRRYTNTNRFLSELRPLLRDGDVRRARSVCQKSTACVCSIANAGLSQAEHGITVMERALATAIARERIELEDKLVLLNEFGRIALLAGILGTLFDVAALGGAKAAASFTDTASYSLYTAMIGTIMPAIGGLLVAIPAWLARSVFNVHVQRVLRESEFVARLMVSELTVVETATTGSPNVAMKIRRLAE